MKSNQPIGIGGSDAPVILGISKWKTPFQLYQEKTGEKKYTVENDAIHWGIILEAVVAAEYARRNRVKVARSNATIQHPKYPWMIGNIDRRVLNKDGGMLLEVKTAGRWANMEEWGEDGSSDIPAAYMAQIQHYLAITGWANADLVALIAGQDFRTYHIKPDAAYIENLIKEEEIFWNRIQEKNPPPPVNPDDFVRRWPIDNGQSVIATEEIEEAIFDYSEITSSIKKLEDEKDSLKFTIESFLGEKSFIIGADGREMASCKSQESNRLDVKKIKIELPEVAEKYNEKTVTRVLRLKKQKKED